ncbi:MAG: carbohydrate ABC transporter permease [Treponema sp.]|jgi:multiple sugar transport system permease protein|nr:carbohydrate ABC transporter permease [Treponema sp.]
MKNPRKRFIDIFIFYIPLVITLIFVLAPFFWVVTTAFKPESDIIQRPIKYLPNPATFDNFVSAWRNVGFDRFFTNSFSIAIIVAFIVVIFSTLVAYPLTRFNFRGKKLTVVLLLCTQFLPHSMLLVPLFMIFRNMGLINSHLALVITYTTFALPFNTILMRGFMSAIPVSMEEAAMIDGCGRLGAIYRVVLPMLLPAVVACASFAFIDAWKEFLFALMFIMDPAKMTIPVGLRTMIGEFSVSYGTLAAGAMIAIIPPMLMFSYMQKYLVKGLSSGGVKG